MDPGGVRGATTWTSMASLTQASGEVEGGERICLMVDVNLCCHYMSLGCGSICP